MATKRKHIEVTLKNKKVLQGLEKGKYTEDVTARFNVPESNLFTWKKNKEQIYDTFKTLSLKKQLLKIDVYEKVN